MLSRIKNYLLSDKELLKQGSVLFISMFVFFVINYVFQFSMGRLLGPADYGILSVFFSIIYLAVAPMNSIQLIIAKYVSEMRAKNEFSKIGAFVKKSVFGIFMCSIALTTLTIIFRNPLSEFLNTGEPKYIVIFSFVFIGVFVVSGLRGFLQGMQRFKVLSLNFLAEGVTKLLFAVGFVLLGYGLGGTLWAINISLAIVLILTLMPLFSKKFEYAKHKFEWKTILAYAVPTIIAMSLITAFYTVDVLIVKHFFSAVDAGYYAAASLMAKIIFFASMSINQVMFPKISEMHTTGKNFNDVFNKCILFVVSLSVIGALAYLLIPKFIITTFFGAEYLAASAYLGLLGVAIALFSVSYVLVNYFLAIKKLGFVWILVAWLVTEIVLFYLFHESLTLIVRMFALVMGALLLSLSCLYFICKKCQ